jgi:vacuolar-type H+-ATPase subunit I/STV1
MLNRQGRPLSQSKRAKQNRAAQRAFRQRKEVYIKDLETKVQELKEAQDAIDSLEKENRQLRDYILALQSKFIGQPGGVPTPPAVYERRQQQELQQQFDETTNGMDGAQPPPPPPPPAPTDMENNAN